MLKAELIITGLSVADKCVYAMLVTLTLCFVFVLLAHEKKFQLQCRFSGVGNAKLPKHFHRPLWCHFCFHTIFFLFLLIFNSVAFLVLVQLLEKDT